MSASRFPHLPRLPRIRLPAGAAVAALLAAYVAPALAADAAPASSASASYARERADCEAGKTAQDRATCLREAGAAADERKRNRLDNSGSMPQNATDRCNALPATERADCTARIKGPAGAGQRTTTSGSVAGGGIVRETVTVVPGAASSSTPVRAASEPK